MSRRVAVVSDSSSVDAAMAERLGVRVVPLQVVIGSRTYQEGSDTTSEQVADALRDGEEVSTSRPPPAAFLHAYDDAAAHGADEVVAVLLSGEVSGTVEAAQVAAGESSLPVHVVDSRQLGMATGFAVESAVTAVQNGEDGAGAAAAAGARAVAARALFYVDTLEYLRRGGRLSAAAALLGSALAVKPLLQVDGGRVVPLDRVRTASRALARLTELAVDTAADTTEATPVDVAVSHLAAAERAQTLAEDLRERMPQVGTLIVNQVGAALGAHVGPGMVAVVVAPRQGEPLGAAPR